MSLQASHLRGLLRLLLRKSSSRGALLLLRSSRYALTRPDHYAADVSRSSGNLTTSPQVYFASAHVVGGLDDRGDFLPARTSTQERSANLRAHVASLHVTAALS